MLVRIVENLTGRVGLIRRAKDYEHDISTGRSFWDVMPERFGLELECISGSLKLIPKEGPLILTSNHPYGILDGLMLGHILAARREEAFRIIANHVFQKAEALNQIILPISFDETPEGIATNLQTRKDAIAYLKAGGAIGIFPGGTVSTARRPFGTPLDPGWRNFTARMVLKSQATIVPLYFEGANSRLFQIASHLHSTLRLALLIKEFRARINEPVRVAIGQPITPDEIAAHKSDPTALMHWLRSKSYALADPQSKSAQGFRCMGHEFEARHGASDRRVNWY